MKIIDLPDNPAFIADIMEWALPDGTEIKAGKIWYSNLHYFYI